MSNIYFLARTYSPSAASDIRYRSFLQGFGDNVITFVYFLPDENRSVLSVSQSNIRVNNIWEGHNVRNKFFKQFFYFYQQYKFAKTLKEGDIVVDLACPELLPILSRKKGIKLYYEISEHPEVSFCSSRFLVPSIDRFLRYCRKLTGLFVISNSLKDYFASNGVDIDKIHIINMTVDGSRFSSLKKSNNTERYIAYCGTASNNKDGVDQLIKAFAIVKKKIPDVKLLIIGRTPDSGQAFDNAKLVEALGLKGDVVFTGALPFNKVPQLLYDAEVLALARPDNKQAKFGFPTKLGEYLMTGNPVVVTRVGEIPLFLENDKSAYISEPNNVDEFSMLLIEALSNKDKSNSIGLAGKSVAERFFSGKVEGKKLLSILLR